LRIIEKALVSIPVSEFSYFAFIPGRKFGEVPGDAGYSL
jgi:hypothetical protein